MRKHVLLLLCVIAFMFLQVSLAAQTWPFTYDFGTVTGSFTTPSTGSTTFMPALPAGLGTPYVYCGNQGGGVHLDNPGIPTIGTGTELRLNASTGTSPVKYSVYGYTPAAGTDRSAFGRMNAVFGGLSNGNVTTNATGTFYYLIGSGVRANPATLNIYNTGTLFDATTSDQMYAGLRFVLSADGTMTIAYPTRSGNNLVWTNITGTYYQGILYRFEIFSNNKNNGNTYTHIGGNYSLSNNKYDLWINNALAMPGLTYYGPYGNNTQIDSWMWYAESSTSNTANVFIDDITYDDTCTTVGYTVSDPTDYYSKPTGALNDLTTWVTNADGSSGNNPANFTSIFQKFHIQNNPTPTITANWTVGATATDSTTVVIGNGTARTVFTVPAAFTYAGKTLVEYNGVLKMVNTTMPTIQTLNPGSTMEFASSTPFSIPTHPYKRMAISGTGVKTLTYNLTLPDSLLLYSSQLDLGTYTLTDNVYIGDPNNTYLGNGYLCYDNTGRASGTGINALTNFRVTTPLTYAFPGTIGNLDVQAATTLSGSTSVNNLNLTAPLTVGANTLTLRGNLTGSSLVTTTSSNLTIAGTAASLAIPANLALNTLTLNRPNGAILTSNLSPSYLVLSSGNLTIGNYILSVTNPITYTGGTLTGGYTSNMTVTTPTPNLIAAQLNDLNINVGAANTLVMPNDVSLVDVTFTAGKLGLNGKKLSIPSKGIAFTSPNGVFSSLGITMTNTAVSYNGGYSIHRWWATNAVLQNSVDITFSYPATESVSSTMRVWRRVDAGWWYPVGTYPATLNGSNREITVPGITALTGNLKGNMEWTIAELNQTLPVELSSFAAIFNVTTYVTLQWITQSETGMTGYYIYRSTSNDINTAERINAFIPASNTSVEQTYIFQDSEIQPATTYWYWLQSNDLDGGYEFFGPVTVTIPEDNNNNTPEIPLLTSLQSIYPNPFNPDVTIRFGLKKAADVTMNIYNIRGELVKHLLVANKAAGNHTIHWNGKTDDGKSLPSGTYLLNMTSGGKTCHAKLVLMK